MSEAGRMVAIDLLLQLKLGRIYGWKAPEPLHDVGPSNERRFEEFQDSVRHIQEMVRVALEEQEDRKLRALLNKQADAEMSRWFEQLYKAQIAVLLSQEPVWIAFGFGHPDHAADFEYWAKVGLLSVQEATLLSVGLEPNKEHLHFLERVREVAGLPNKNDQAVFLSKRYRLMQDHFPFGVSSFMSVSPEWFLKLIKKIDIEVPDGLMSSLAYLEGPTADSGAVKKQESMSSLEKESLLRMIAAMACEQYDFDPRASRSQAVPNLRHDLDSVGLPLDDKTIRKWLREACELVPKVYWEN